MEIDFSIILPLTVLTTWAGVLLLLDLFIPASRKSVTAFLAALGLAIALGINLMQAGNQGMSFNGMVIFDGFAAFTSTLILVCGLFGIALSHGYLKRMGIERGEYYTLMLFSVVGMLLMVQASDLIIVFLALELLSIPLYVLVAFDRANQKSGEAGLKYFLLGTFATGFFVYGTALIFGATGTTSLPGILMASSSHSPMLVMGAAIVLIGFGFKVAAVPFHMWTPDVYQGAPSAVTAFMSSGAKIAGFAALLRVFVMAFPNFSSDLTPILWALSALTMVVGNFTAIAQTNIKRMLAYSSIAHAGYILMAFVPYGDHSVFPISVAAGLFYFLSYILTNFGVWGIVISLEKQDGTGLQVSDYMGLSKSHPALAAAMAIFMLSLIGFPPTLGMIGKLYLFRSAIQGGFYGLAVVGVLTSLVSAYYYLRIVVNMYMKEGQPQITREPWLNITIAVTAIATVVISLMPQGLFLLAGSAILGLF